MRPKFKLMKCLDDWYNMYADSENNFFIPKQLLFSLTSVYVIKISKEQVVLLFAQGHSEKRHFAKKHFGKESF